MTDPVRSTSEPHAAPPTPTIQTEGPLRTAGTGASAGPHDGESPTVDDFRRKIGQEMVNNLNRHALKQQAEQEAGAPFTVLVDDNFHYQDVDERYELGKFDTLNAALQACRAIVDDGLADDMRQHPGVTAAELYDRYTSFGEDPFIRPAVALQTRVLFSAWDYAKRRCGELTCTTHTKQE